MGNRVFSFLARSLISCRGTNESRCPANAIFYIHSEEKNARVGGQRARASPSDHLRRVSRGRSGAISRGKRPRVSENAFVFA